MHTRTFALIFVFGQYCSRELTVLLDQALPSKNFSILPQTSIRPYFRAKERLLYMYNQVRFDPSSLPD